MSNKKKGNKNKTPRSNKRAASPAAVNTKDRETKRRNKQRQESGTTVAAIRTDNSSKISSLTTRTSSATAPGKLILFGEHAVVYKDKRALACALDLSTTTTVSSSTTTDIPSPLPVFLIISLPEVSIIDLRVNLTDLQSAFENSKTTDFSPEVLSRNKLLIDSLEQFLDATIAVNVSQNTVESTATGRRALLTLLVLYIGITSTTPTTQFMDIKIHTTSKIPTGSGLGSSASFCVSLAAALLRHVNKISSTETAAITKTSATNTNGNTTSIPENQHRQQQLDRTVINAWALCGETVLHGLVSGVDNTVVCFGGVNVYVKGCEMMQVQGLAGGLRMLITNTKVEKDTKKQVGIVSGRMEAMEGVVSKLVDAVDAVVGEACRVFKEYDEGRVKIGKFYDTIETLIQMNHGILVSLGVSHPSLDQIALITQKYGLVSKLTGAGGGGCAVTLIREDYDNEQLKTVINELEEAGFECFEGNVGCAGVSWE